MAELGLAGATRGKSRRTTIADPAAARPADLVQRQFAPPAPNRLWVADLTYVSTWSGFAYVALVVDAYARRILGWRVASTMTTSMVLDAIEQSIWTRQQEGVLDLKDVVHHTDRGSQGGFKWSSQHLDQEVYGWDGQEGGRVQRQGGRRCARRAVLQWRDVNTVSGSGRRSLKGYPVRTRGWRPACRLQSGHDGSVKVAAWHQSLGSPYRGATCHSKSEKRLHSCAPKTMGCARSRDASAVMHRRFRGSCVATPRPAAGVWTTGPRLRSGMPTGVLVARRWPNSPLATP